MCSAHNTHQDAERPCRSLANCVGALRATAFHYLTSDRNAVDARSNKVTFTHISTKPATLAPVRANGQCTHKRKIQPRSRNHCYGTKAINITYSERVFLALVTQHAKCMGRIILPSVTRLAQQYLSTL